MRVIRFGFQRAGHLHIAQIDIRDHREAQRDRARARRNDHFVQRAEGIHERRNAFLGILEQTRQIAGLYAAEDQRRANRHGYDVDYAGHIVSQRHYAKFQTQLYARFDRLIDAIADQEREQTLGLVILDDAGYVLRIVALAEHNRNAGNIARNQRDAQRTNYRIGNETDARFILIRIFAFDIFQTFQNFRAHGGGKAGVQRVAQFRLVADQALQHAYACGQIAQLGNLYARRGINRREEIGGIRERALCIRTVLGNHVVHCLFRQTGHRVGTGKYQIGQCAHRKKPPQCLGNRALKDIFRPSVRVHTHSLTLYPEKPQKIKCGKVVGNKN